MMRQASHGSWQTIGRIGTVLGALLLIVAGGVGTPVSDTPHAASTSVGGYQYQLHMAFFSRETGQPRVIDPQMFVATPGAPASVGPQMIRHVAGVLPVLANASAGTPLRDALGRLFGVTLGHWEAARGTATLTCQGGSASLVSRFTELLPRAAYSLFIVHLQVQGPRRFTPLGAPDGRGSAFVTGTTGTWTETSTVAPCLTPAEAVVLVWDSDGRAHGAGIGEPGVTAHNQLIAPLASPSGAGRGTM